MANELMIQEDDARKKLIRETFCKGASDNEFELFLAMSKRAGLDPTMKQVYAVKRWNSQLKREEMTVQTGIDGLRLIADRTGKYAPGDEATFHYDDNKNLVSATAYIKKQTADGSWHKVSSTAFFEEYVQKTKEGKPTSFWMRMPHVMLSKCAEALALRKAFPAEMSGIYIKEEMDQADNPPAPLEEAVQEVEEENEIVIVSSDQQVEQVQQVSKIENKEKLREYMAHCCSKYKIPLEQAIEKWTSNPENLVKCYNKWMEKSASEAQTA